MNTKSSRLSIKIELREASLLLFLCGNIVTSFFALFLPQNLFRVFLIEIITFLPLLIYLLQPYEKRLRPGKPYYRFQWVPISFVLLILFYFYYYTWNDPLRSEFMIPLMWSNVFYVATGVMGYILIRQIDDPTVAINVLNKAAVINFLYVNIRYFGVREYNMGFGYLLLGPCLLFFDAFFFEKKRVYLIFAIVSSIEIFAYGSRGGALSIVFFLAFRIIVQLLNKRNRFRTIKIIGISIISIFVYLTYDVLYSFLKRLILSSGIQSRTILLLFGQISETSTDTRLRIYDDAKIIIEKSSFWGNGPLYDQYEIGNYCHNIFLEFMVTFGKIPGLVLISSFLLTFVYCLKKSFGTEWFRLLTVMFFASFVKLMISATFWYEQYFWMCLGTMVVYLKLEHKKRRTEND